MMPFSSSFYPINLRLTIITFIFICSLILSHSILSDGFQPSSYNEIMHRKKMILGSRPPACVGKCKNCKPCKATLVIPPHQKMSKQSYYSHRGGTQDDDTYYLLSWKCTCGNKLFHP